ncbi:Cytochrome P450 9e2 [Gryllus bimaculatus]|nr:Cytochrome P450 9e2 [Gryllus bimaculatus]
MGELALRRTSLPEFTLKLYAARGVVGPQVEAEAPLVGFFEFRRPIVVVRDAALLRDVCVKRFDHFRNHRRLPAQADDLFSRSLFALRDRRWKDLRAAMSPAFTASKMRALFDLISQCGHQSARFLEQRCRELPEEANGVYELEFKDFFTRFANDVIATSAFGVECDSFGQPDNEFYQMGKTITNFGGLRGIIMLLFSLAPKLAVLLRLSFLGAKADAFFRALIREALAERAARGIYRPDVLQLMMEARDGGLGPQAPDAQPRATMTDEDIMGQAVLFFFAGFETVSLLMCFSCHLLALHPDAQARLHREIDAAVDASGGHLDYDAVGRMKYLDMVLSETLRLYPPAPAVDRECAEDVELELGEGRAPARLRKGDVLWLPIMGVQRDPRYWPRPDAFDPERFSDANKHCIHPFTYMPFGLGPRVCLVCCPVMSYRVMRCPVLSCSVSPVMSCIVMRYVTCDEA